MSRIDALAWSAEQLPEALSELGRRAGLGSRVVELPRIPAGSSREQVGSYLERVAAWLGFEAEPIRIPRSEDGALGRMAPGLIVLEQRGLPDAFLAVASGDARRVELLGPGGQHLSLLVAELRAAIWESAEKALSPAIDRLLDVARISGPRRQRARSFLLDERLGRAGACEGWLLRHPASASLWTLFRASRLGPRAAVLVAAHAVQYLFTLLGWWIIGQGVLSGRMDRGWLLGWILLLVSQLPLRLLAVSTASTLAIGVGTLLKQRLLAGALALEPELLRRKGAGQLLGEVFESSALESLAINGGLLGALAVVEWLMAVWVLSSGASAPWLLALLVGWLGVALLLARRYVASSDQWSRSRMTLTDTLVEHMVGHRTRLAQEEPGGWHKREDQLLEHYLSRGQEMDGAGVRLAALVPRGWLALAVAALTPALVTAGPESFAALAVALGGILLAYRAFRKLAGSFTALAEAALAWRRLQPLSEAAARAPAPAVPLPEARAGSGTPAGRVLIDASDLEYRVPGKAEPVLSGCSLVLRSGERLLLEGESGGGKSTLVSLLAGLRAPSSGLLLLEGVDRQTLGAEGWRRRAVVAPQFHENYVLGGPLAFNLLCGRRWPPTPEDLAEAEQVCRELMLGPLLDRMPSGLQQQVGETGWQLSHGERSRVYIARALLQGAEVVFLDESFAALDPETLEQAVKCVLRRARTVMIVAHP
jgi:ATP-binding cassette subfamily B protein